MKRLLLIALAMLCACNPLFCQSMATASLSNYAGSTLTATDLTTSAHSTTAMVASNGGISLSLYVGEYYTFSVTAASSTYPAFTTGRTLVTANPYRQVDISQTLAAGAASVYVAPAVSSGSPVVTSSALQGLSPALGTTTTVAINSTMVADQAVSGAGNNGLANLVSGPCASGSATLACSLMVSPLYSSEFSRYFNVAASGNEDAYQLFPVAGGMTRARFAEDRRLANLFFSSINARPLENNGTYNGISPFVFEQRSMVKYNFQDYLSAMLLRQRLYGVGHNYYTSAGQGQKGNFAMLSLDSIVTSALQGGGFINSVLRHTSHGDDMVQTVQHDTMGCSEGEDECDKFERSFLGTTVSRWGGTVASTPVLDSYGNATFAVAVTGGYDPKQAGEDMFLINLSRQYTTGSIKSIINSGYPGLVSIAGDTTANWAANYGASAITTLTATIDGKTYNGSCPSTVTNATPLVDPLNTGQGGTGQILSFCATVASTAGFSANQKITIAGPHSNLEMTQVQTVVDSTHMVLKSNSALHDPGEVIAGAGAQGYGICKTGDDIAIGGLLNYPAQPNTILHKCYPIVGSDSSGNLLVYLNTARDSSMSSVTYASNAPNVAATVAVTAGGGGVSAVTVTNYPDYFAHVSGQVGGGQNSLAPPALTFSGCTVAPTYTTTYSIVNNRLTPAFAINSPGTCSSPSATVQSVYQIPYRIVPLTMTKSVVDPVTGSATNGTLVTGNIKPADWQTGDTVEIPGWIHDDVRSFRNFKKYFTSGGSGLLGMASADYFSGDWSKDVQLHGIVNLTDGYKYYTDATHPLGPGVAYEIPPDGQLMAGNLDILHPVSMPPRTGIFDVGCIQPPAGGTVFHPCLNGTQTAYSIFHPHSEITDHTFSYDLRFDGGAAGLLSWSGPFSASSYNGVALATGTHLTVGEGATRNGPTVGTANHTICAAFIVPPNGLSVGHVAFRSSAGDGGSGALSDFGIYGPTGALLAHIGALGLPYDNANYTVAFLGGARPIPGDKNYACYTSTGTALSLVVSTNAPAVYPIQDIGVTTTGGALNASITAPSDAPDASAYLAIPAFVLYP